MPSATSCGADGTDGTPGVGWGTRPGTPGDDVGGSGEVGSNAPLPASGYPLFGAVDELRADGVCAGAALTRCALTLAPPRPSAAATIPKQ